MYGRQMWITVRITCRKKQIKNPAEAGFLIAYPNLAEAGLERQSVM